MSIAFSLPRRVEPELLDELGADDPRARQSRADLRRIHRAMATLPILRTALDQVSSTPPRRILELGAGDGSLMLRLARQRARRWPGVHLGLLDRVALVDEQTRSSFGGLGWTTEVLATDVFEWLAQRIETDWDIVVANLFMHHFSPAALAGMLASIAERTRVFFCCEPRRTTMPLLASHLVGLLGANAVTRQDAVLSVHAGFRGNELSALWPDPERWQLREYRAGLFSHGFMAVRRGQTA